MDIKTRLTRCCGKDMGSGLTCHDGMRCPDCFDKLEGWREIEQLREALDLIVIYWDEWMDNDDDVLALSLEEVVLIARSSLQQKDSE